ncbi:diguanylate cyclase regulator RdcB family protein [Calothrix sp. 336/3]|uniref:diguanylate cyclase regulator RdcB family protein n=1 Tax=Calothrix sp. 336/3 TaxID=1337936 RepID=UPI0006244AD0|nr:diguanylate cyclase regulator RdcB family protein [Calothrix sp. 336/3]AKG21672.1 hypothetical protein IJ00_10745 [Calothrix sp. 336/3]
MLISNPEENNMPSSFILHLKHLQHRIPVVSDKALIDLVNGIQVSQHILRYRKDRGWLGKLIDKVDGSDHTRRLLLDGNLIAGQKALYNWVQELVENLRISNVALSGTRKSLLEARNAIRDLKETSQIQGEELLQLKYQLSMLAQQVSVYLHDLEARVRSLEVKVAANQDLDRIVTAWSAGQTYRLLPWTLQVALLVREVFSSSVVMYELETGDLKSYRELLVNKILANTKQLQPPSGCSLADLLDESWTEIKNNDDLELVTGLLEVHSIPRERLINTPHLFVIGTTLELATLPEEARPSQPGQSAIALCRAHIDDIYRTTDAKTFVDAVTQETANDCLLMIGNNFEK